MKNKIKKIILLGLVLVLMLFAVVNTSLFSADACGCSETYMGARLVFSYCTHVDGEIDWRRCEYVY